MKRRFISLSAIAIVYKIIGALIFAGCFIGSGLMLVAALTGGGEQLMEVAPIASASLSLFLIMLAFQVFIIGLFMGLGLYAAGECFEVFIATEENTRRTADLLERRASRPAPAQAQTTTN